jgi:polysaccharide pyruvyl transferase WcaK-like protein
VRYGITGWYGHKNVGDEILLKCALDYFGRKQAVVFATNSLAAENVRVSHGVKAFDVQSIPEHDLDFLLFAGGDVLHNLVVEWYFPKSLMEKIQCPILMLSVGIPFGEGRTPLSKTIDYLRRDWILFRSVDRILERFFQTCGMSLVSCCLILLSY